MSRKSRMHRGLTSAENDLGQSESRLDHLIEDITPSVRQIIDDMQRQSLLHGDQIEDLLDRTIRYLKLDMRSAMPEIWTHHSPNSIKALAIYKALQVLNPQPKSDAPLPGQKFQVSPALPEQTGYQVKIHYQPKYQVGGDLVSVHVAANNDVWILLADVMGKSVAAHLTAASLEALWELRQEIELNEPLEVMQWFEREISEYLPKNRVHVEIVLLRADSRGEVRAAAGGDIQYLLGCHAAKTVKAIRFGGMLLGREYPEFFTEHNEVIPVHHELVFATDGVFDQPNSEGCLRESLEGQVERSVSGTSLHDAVTKIVLDTLRVHPQHDDIAVVSLLRLDRSTGSGKVT